jgi:peptidoglycan/xylan/chitin deacetylase (PgdA/CDA1 family)
VQYLDIFYLRLLMETVTEFKMQKKIKLMILWAARWGGMFALSRWLTRSQLRIVCYHGGAVGDESKYNPKLFISAATLRSRIRWLERKGFNIVSLDAATGCAGDDVGQVGHKPLQTVLTFDDGWYSTGSELLPVLTALKLPSTLYLCTKHFVEGWPVLSVAVRYILWKSALRSVTLTDLHVAVDSQYDLATPRSRDHFVKVVIEWIEKSCVNREEICTALERLGAALSVSPGDIQLQTRRFDYMSGQELLKAAADACRIELHGHVHHYPAGEPAKFRLDLQTCASVIIGTGLPAPRHYCYPSGGFDSAASATLTDLNVVTATTCIPGLVKRVDKASRHYLPRFLDGEDVHMLEFEAELSGFSEILRRVLRSNNTRGSNYAA